RLEHLGVTQELITKCGMSMINLNAASPHCFYKFFSKIIGFGGVLQTYSNLIGRQKPNVFIFVVARARSWLPHIVFRRPMNPELRKMAKVRPDVGLAEQLDVPV